MNIKSSKSEVRREIADLISRIKEQSDRIGMQREIPQMELDLILHRIEELHRKTVVWSYLNELPEMVPDPEFRVAGAVTEAPVQEPLTPITEEKVLQNDIQAEKFEAPTNPEPVVVNVSEEKKVEPAQEPAPLVPAEPKNDKTGARNLKDIRTFIGFNEKLMYIRQVFAGDSSAYEEALNQINAMQTHAEAEAFLSVLAGSYKWNRDNEPVAIFLQTIKRRFA